MGTKQAFINTFLALSFMYLFVRFYWILTVSLLLVSCLIILHYSWVTRNFKKWKKFGIPYVEPSFPFGTSKEWVLRKKNISDVLMEQSSQFPHAKVFGTFRGDQPILVVNDPDISKDILTKNFHNFTERNDKATRSAFKGGDYDKVFGSQLTWLEGNKWREARSTFSPIFTNQKLKKMVELIQVITDNLVNGMSEKQGQEIDLLSVFELFSIDSVASCAFGIDAKSFENMDSPFTKQTRIFNNINGPTMFALWAMRFPGLSTLNKMFKFNIYKPNQIKFFLQTIRHSIMKKNSQNGQRIQQNMLDFIIEAMKEEEKSQEDKVNDDQFEEDANLHSNERIKQFDEVTLLATAMFFITAGAETTATTLGYATYYLAKNTDVQTKLQEEVDEAYNDAGGEMPGFSTILSLPLLDQVIHETLRLHPPVAGITRVAGHEYKIPGTEVVLEEDDMVMINAIGIHFNEELYPNPTVFNPQNFSKEAIKNRNPYAFLSFSQGPRNCIGMRFALLEAKMALLAFLRNFRLIRSEKTCDTPILDPCSFISSPLGGLWARIEKRDF